jgi:glutamyl-tRNA reductase
VNRRIAVTGLNHTTAPVAVREKLAIGPERLPAALAALQSQNGVIEGLILSTCNRVEVVVTAQADADARTLLQGFLCEQAGVDGSWLQQYLYHHEGAEAMRHLFRVASSLDSMVVGEPQILGQLKQAFEAAKVQGTLEGYLETVLSRAFNVAKRVRTETDIGSSPVSVAYTAVQLARDIFGSLENKTVMLVGAGKMSELAARHLQRAGISHIYVTNRTESRAREMAELFKGRVVPYDRFIATLPEVDIVITSSGAPDYIIRRDDMKRVIDSRRNRPVFLIDIAVPRNIEPRVNQLDNIFVYDMDDLQQVVEQNRRGRMVEAEQADAIVSEELERLEQWLRTRQVVPTIVSLQEQLETLRTNEIERMRGRLGTLTAQQEEALDALTRGLVNKIAHGPITELRRQAQAPNGLGAIGVIRRVFRLDE